MRTILGTDEVIVGDLMLCQVLKGLEGERAERDVEALLRRFQIVSMVGHVSSRTLAFVIKLSRPAYRL
jgi:hypothetical protein